jgi:alpha/beta superfamily hydrolase
VQAETIAFAAPGGELEGAWRPGRGGGAVVAPPHPLYGGHLDHPVVHAICDALAHAGLATLAFNWRGVGASNGAPSGELADADADFGAALAELARRGAAAPLVGAGYSFGAATALRAADGVARLVLVAPPVAMVGADDLRRCTKPLVVVAGAADDYAPAGAVAALMPKRADARLAILPRVDHFFAAPEALARLAEALGEMPP